MNSQRRTGTPSTATWRDRGVADAEGSVPGMLARLEAAFPAEPARDDGRWSPVARLATLAAGCAGSWGLVALVVHVAAPLV